MAILTPFADLLNHSLLTNLTVDTHSQYPLSQGRAIPAQWLIGSTLAGGSLVLQSTSHATPGTVEAGPLIIDEGQQRVGVGVDEALAILHAGGPVRIDNDTDDANRALILGALAGDSSTFTRIGYFLVEYEGGLYTVPVGSYNGSTLGGATVQSPWGVQLLWDVAGAAALPADTFTAGDVDHPLPTSSSGHTWSDTTPVSNTSWWGIASNTAKCYSFHGEAALAFAWLDGQSADGSVQVTLSTVGAGNSQSGLCLRMDDAAETGYIVGSNGTTAGTWFVGEWSGTAWTSYRTFGGGIPPANGRVLKVTMSGQQFTVYVDGTQVDQATGYTTNQSSTKHGLATANGTDWNNVRWDDFSFAL